MARIKGKTELWQRLVADLEFDDLGTRRGRPLRHRDVTVLYHVLAALGRMRSQNLRHPGARWSVGWAWRGARNRPSGSQCLRRLRGWQSNGGWEMVVKHLRSWARSQPLPIQYSKMLKTESDLEIVERIANAAKLRRRSHERGKRRSNSEHDLLTSQRPG